MVLYEMLTHLKYLLRQNYRKRCRYYNSHVMNESVKVNRNRATRLQGVDRSYLAPRVRNKANGSDVIAKLEPLWQTGTGIYNSKSGCPRGVSNLGMPGSSGSLSSLPGEKTIGVRSQPLRFGCKSKFESKYKVVQGIRCSVRHQ